MIIEKRRILEEIKRTAHENNGVPLGMGRFCRETGIKKYDWFGKYWARWGDAIQEAGLPPNQMTVAYDDEYLIAKLAEFIGEIGRFPAVGDFRMKGRKDETFPDEGAFRRLGDRQQLASKVADFCRQQGGADKVIQICLPLSASGKGAEVDGQSDNDSEEFGYVYLIKSGKHYKIGRSNAAGRREYELAIQLPEKAKTIHLIRTDDPAGIEAYWHRRFESKHLNGEWFDLSAEDIKAFRRRKFVNADMIALFYLWLPKVEIAIQRIRDCVRRGGHDVPDEDIRRRFNRGVKNLFGEYRPLLDTWSLFDNSGPQPRLIAIENNGQLKILEENLFRQIEHSVEAP